MGLGGTAKKLQKVMDAAEQLYSRMNEVLERLKSLETDVEHTSTQVDDLEREVAEQRVLLEAIATQQGLDIETILENADLPPKSPDGDRDDTEQSTDTSVDVTEEG
jgi:DNA anti-recombination protein RmuC